MRKFLYSPGYGAGWVTWHSGSREEKEFMLFYQPWIEALEKGTKGKNLDQEMFTRHFEEKFPGSNLPYFGGVEQLMVGKVPDEEEIVLREYDGSESFTSYSRIDRY